jgi:transcriptional regulator GlxA family with amidase domain
MEYVTQYRLSHAQRLLATTDLKILDVALASGFGSASRFYQVFMAMCGLTPRDYRASLKLPALTK